MKKDKKFITHYDNFLDPNLTTQINIHVEKVKKTPVWRTSHGWEEGVKRLSTPVPILELPDQFAIPIHRRLREVPELSWKDNSIPRRPQYYLYPPGSYLGWHNDGKYDFAAMIFLNPIWNMEWGGLFLHEDLKGGAIRAEIPIFNRCLLTAGGVAHGVSRLTPDAAVRRVIIVFGPLSSKKVKAKRDKEHMKWREKNNMGAMYVSHKEIEYVRGYLNAKKKDEKTN